MSSAESEPNRYPVQTVILVVMAGCLIGMLSFGLRSTFGLFLEPISSANAWPRETFAISLAVQNLLIGLCAPISGAIADRLGARKALTIGALLYAGGIWGIPQSDAPILMMFFAGIMVGVGVSFTTFTVSLSAMVKVVGPERRSFVLGLGTAVGSFGQVLFTPLGQAFITNYGWQSALYILAATALAILPAAFLIPASGSVQESKSEPKQSISSALTEAAGHRGYLLLVSGFFVCGFHVAFISIHFPAFVQDSGLSPQTGAFALAIVGLFNIVGSFCSGLAGQRWSKKRGLSVLYFSRAIAITLLILAPKTELTIYLFAAVMGLLWLSTIPLTSGIVAQIFGVRYMATLFGIVQLSHQTGAFMGAWLGGRFYDLTGSYDTVWWIAVGLGIFAALVHIPINEKPIERSPEAPSNVGNR